LSTGGGKKPFLSTGEYGYPVLGHPHPAPKSLCPGQIVLKKHPISCGLFFLTYNSLFHIFDAFQSEFVSFHYHSIKAVWLDAGDLGTHDEDFYVYLVNRKKDLIISDGMNIYPAVIERVIYEHPSVSQCAVIGGPDDR
jgi:acyl-CoA synthetase (AMP-forming)/AMP-acid ligase II